MDELVREMKALRVKQGRLEFAERTKSMEEAWRENENRIE